MSQLLCFWHISHLHLPLLVCVIFVRPCARLSSPTADCLLTTPTPTTTTTPPHPTPSPHHPQLPHHPNHLTNLPPPPPPPPPPPNHPNHLTIPSTSLPQSPHHPNHLTIPRPLSFLDHLSLIQETAYQKPFLAPSLLCQPLCF